MSRPYTIVSEVQVTEIPAGTPAVLASGTQVHVVQTLGGNVTVRTDHGLFRINAADASVLGPDFVAAMGAGGDTVGESSAGAFSEQAVWEALKLCFDPEIPLNIVDLGLIYDLDIEKMPSGLNRVSVKMTLTAQGCGMGPVIAGDARQKVLALPEVEDAQVVIVWDPIWTPHMISPEGRKLLGLE